ncbi:rubisco accumulation factor 1.2, chloroplastic-like [Rosa chinensis]|uniref:rubisco accumulation factor 1.2, chloroplastic-like n=1 Tax=Rosa chinensis TaxID=74649 RepID=UPI000D093EB1|nr:rubisco accumulation factor 1.2, chloroplastic-like [Rosa chinensis]
MLSLTSNTLKPFSPFTSTTTLNPHPPPLLYPKPTLKPVSASIQHLLSSTPKPKPPQPNQQVYQPFRPPPSPIPEQYRSLDANGHLEILANRLGLWYEFAPLISSLLQPTIEEITGISSVEQNRLVVAAQVGQYPNFDQARTSRSILNSLPKFKPFTFRYGILVKRFKVMK